MKISQSPNFIVGYLRFLQLLSAIYLCYTNVRDLAFSDFLFRAGFKVECQTMVQKMRDFQ